MSEERTCCSIHILGTQACLLFFASSAVLTSVHPANGQTLVGLRIEGPEAVLEESTAEYVAIAEFDNGNEYEVTLFAEWSVAPDTYAEIDQYGILTTFEAPADEVIAVMAVFTWDDVTLEASQDVTILDATEGPAADPWPEWQKSPARLGRTTTVGPQTPRIDWTIQVDFGFPGVELWGGPVMDKEGRVFVGGIEGITCVDTKTRSLLWQFPVPQDGVFRPATIRNGKVLFGGQDSKFYCVDAVTGEEVWSIIMPGDPLEAQAVDESQEDGVVYFATAGTNQLHARRINDGSELWTISSSDAVLSPPALDGLGRLFTGGDISARARAIADGQSIWIGPAYQNFGVTPILAAEGRIYVATYFPTLFCLDSTTGEEIFSYDGLAQNTGAIAIGHDGTVYVAEVWEFGDLVAVSPDGDELWRYDINEQVIFPPIVGGDGTIYLCSFLHPDKGHVHAVRLDGTALWVKEMPHFVQASPMLAPDGTLYVLCSDKLLYAFQDPAKGDVSLNDIIDGRDIRFFIQVLFGADDDPIRAFAADMNGDGIVDQNDVPLFVEVLLTVAS